MDEETNTRKTWANFMIHFRQAHQELRDTDTTIDELGFQNADAIVEQIVEALRGADDNAPDEHIPPPPPAPAPVLVPPLDPVNQLIP